MTEVRWYLDSTLLFTAYSGNGTTAGWYANSTTAVAPGPDSPFDQPFHILLNLAVRSTSTAFTNKVAVGDTLASPKQMLVDYVRVYGRAPA
ncbi:glucan endo-1,3-beta-D-glucosidase [Micractinium conductrix]|uniref:Glucan endo-1,3-beta-D-glucosidase n=1 Tax=Micractinium conductrix TaxID=554055 RepID=A0A2P6V0Y9_9CHLO|nr:glucan endo-1,3-beta-D-glucosidase [Micractinium conductrix]|eukprot:PSC67752.1 glucan endo-1,3-beta-D-glucosidase [Micractinium conductrix]